MYKVNFSMDKSSISFFKIFKTEHEANNFIKEIGDRFVSLKTI